MRYMEKPVYVDAFQFGVDETPEWFEKLIVERNPTHQGRVWDAVVLRHEDKTTWIYKGNVVVSRDGKILSLLNKVYFDKMYDIVN